MITIQKLKYEFITDDFLRTLEALRPTGLTVSEARFLFKKDYLSFNHIYIALKDGYVVGTATLVLERKFIHKGGMVGHIEDVAVREDCQADGIGSLLIQRLIEIARVMKCYKLILDCKESVKPFYGQLGFFQTEERNMRLNLEENNVRK